MNKIYFVRHGECEFNLLKLFAGQTECPLTELGRGQAVLAAKDILNQQLKIDKIVSSTLWRASESAVIIAESINYPIDQIVTNNLFMERDFGILEGTKRSDFFDTYSYQDIDNAPEAETLDQLRQRAIKAYDYLKTLPEDNILVISHSAFFRAFMRAISSVSLNKEYTNPFTSIKNGKVYELL